MGDHRFVPYGGGRGSYFWTSDAKVQREIETSQWYGRYCRLEETVGEETKEEKAAAEESANTYRVASLQEARELLARVRTERGLEAKSYTNKKSVENGARELGLTLVIG